MPSAARPFKGRRSAPVRACRSVPGSAAPAASRPSTRVCGRSRMHGRRGKNRSSCVYPADATAHTAQSRGKTIFSTRKPLPVAFDQLRFVIPGFELTDRAGAKQNNNIFRARRKRRQACGWLGYKPIDFPRTLRKIGGAHFCFTREVPKNQRLYAQSRGRARLGVRRDATAAGRVGGFSGAGPKRRRRRWEWPGRRSRRR